jgi:hypothetical protein
VFDRLLALTMALTLAAGAIVQPPCCCETLGGSCRIDEEASSVVACCATEAALPPCCVAKLAVAKQGLAKQASTSAASLPCECDGCPTNRPENPLNESTVAPRAPDVNDLPLALSAGPMDPPQVVSLDETQLAGWENLSLDRPPPDRQALLCVWVI